MVLFVLSFPLLLLSVPCRPKSETNDPFSKHSHYSAPLTSQTGSDAQAAKTRSAFYLCFA